MDESPTPHDLAPSTGFFQKVEAVIPRFCLGDIRRALAERGIEGALASRVKRFERAPEEVERYLGNDYLPDFLPQTKIELVLPIDLVPTAVKTIVRKARIRDPRDRVLLSPILRLISIDPPCETIQETVEFPKVPPKRRAETAPSLR